MDAFVDIDIEVLEIESTLAEQNVPINEDVKPIINIEHSGVVPFQPIADEGTEDILEGVDQLDEAYIEFVLAVFAPTPATNSPYDTFLLDYDMNATTNGDDWCEGPLNDDECTLTDGQAGGDSGGGVGGGFAGSGGGGFGDPTGYTPPAPPPDPGQDPGDNGPHECTDENIGGVNIHQDVPVQDPNASTTDSATSIVSALQLEAALDSLGQAFSQSSNNVVSIPSIGNVPINSLFNGVSGQTFNITVDNTLFEAATNTTDEVQIFTTANGHEISVQPNSSVGAYTTADGNIYVDVDYNMNSSLGFTGLMEAIVHEVLHHAFPALSEAQIDQAAKNVIAKLQAIGVLPAPQIDIGGSCMGHVSGE